MLAFAAAVFFLIITPGPGVLSAAGVGASYGRRAGLFYVGGLFLGTNIVAALVVSGVAAAVLAWAPLRVVLMIASTLYLLYLASKIALAGAKVGFIHPETPPGLKEGLLLQFINPKAYAVNTVLFSGFPFDGVSLPAEIALKFVIVNAIWIPIHLLWLQAGIAIRAMDLPGPVQRRINMAMAASMLIVVALSLWRGLAAAG